jgi:hypothetical protein
MAKKRAPLASGEKSKVSESVGDFMPNLSGQGVRERFGGPTSPEIGMDDAYNAIAGVIGSAKPADVLPGNNAGKVAPVRGDKV